MWRQLLVLGVGAVLLVSSAKPDECVGAGCAANGLHIINKFVRQYLEQQPPDVLLADGVHLVSTGDAAAGGRAAADDGSLVTTLEHFLRTHELRIRLPELMPDNENIGRAFREALDDASAANEIGEARRGKIGKRKGGGLFLLMALMFGKTLAAIGFGTVGLLAMKALMVSALALMLSVIVGLKKLLGGGHEEGGHTVIHATAGGHDMHRRKRDAADLAYSAWSHYLNR